MVEKQKNRIQDDDCQLIYNYSNVFFSYFSNQESMCDIKVSSHQLIYIYSGEIVIQKKGKKELIVPAGKCVFIRKDHRILFTKKSKGNNSYKSIALLFDRNFLRNFFQTIDKKFIPKKTTPLTSSTIILPESAGIRSIFISLFPYLNSKEKPLDEIMDYKIKEAIVILLSMNPQFYATLFDFTEPWKIDILDFLNKNYMYELSMQEIASYTGRSLATFKRDFKKISSLTPQKWIQKKRLEKAYEILQSKSQKISDVYIEVGFKNRSHFSSSFKKEFGIAPTQL